MQNSVALGAATKALENNPLGSEGVALEHFHPQIGMVELVTPDQQVALLTTIDENGGYATLGDCMAALQPHDRPIAALISLAELGLIEFDREDDFDEHLTVWRIR